MRIKRYFIQNYIIMILIILVMYGIFGYGFLITKEYLGLFAIGIGAFVFLNRRIILYEDKMIIIDGFKRIEVQFDLIVYLKIDYYEPKFSRVRVPSMFVNLKDDKQKIFRYSSYSRTSLIEIINYIMKKNNMLKMINIDTNIKALIRNEDSRFDIKRRKHENQIGILMIVVMIIFIIYCKFGV